MKKYFKFNNIEIFLILGFFISAFSFSIIISSSYKSYGIIVEKNRFSKDYNALAIKTKDKALKESSIINLLKDKGINNVLTTPIITTIEVGDKLIINKLIGVSKGINIEKYGIIDGRNFTQEEGLGNKKIAIIGYNLKKYAVKIGNKLYIKVFNENYEVVGIMSNSEFFKEISIVPIRSLYFIENKYNDFNLLISTTELNKLNNFNTSELNASNMALPQESVIPYLFKNVSALKDNVYEVLLGMINLILFSFFFAYNIKRKIAIMKVLGAKNRDVYKELLEKTTKICLIGTILGLTASKLTITLINNGFPNSYGYEALNVYNILITSSLIYLISILVSLVILFNVINFKLLKDIR